MEPALWGNTDVRPPSCSPPLRHPCAPFRRPFLVGVPALTPTCMADRTAAERPPNAPPERQGLPHALSTARCRIGADGVFLGGKFWVLSVRIIPTPSLPRHYPHQTYSLHLRIARFLVRVPRGTGARTRCRRRVGWERGSEETRGAKPAIRLFSPSLVRFVPLSDSDSDMIVSDSCESCGFADLCICWGCAGPRSIKRATPVSPRLVARGSFQPVLYL